MTLVEGKRLMPSYEICYLNQDGSLAAKFSTICDDQTKAKVMAHAMKLDGAKQIEVWDGRSLIYTRPTEFVDRRPAANPL
jgi:hypothetical protein